MVLIRGRRLRRCLGLRPNYELYLMCDQMALAARLAEKAGMTLHELVGEAMWYLFQDLDLDVESPNIKDLRKVARRERRDGLR